MKIDRDRFLEEGYLTVREAIPPSQLEAVREAYELLVSYQRRDLGSGAQTGRPARWRMGNRAAAQIASESNLAAIDRTS